MYVCGGMSFHGWRERRKGLENSRERAVALRPYKYQGKQEWGGGVGVIVGPKSSPFWQATRC